MTLAEFASSVPIPEPSEDDGVILKPEMFPELPGELVGHDLRVSVGPHYYDNFLLPKINLFASKETFRGLGCLLFAHALGEPRAATRIHLCLAEPSVYYPQLVRELRVQVDDIRTMEDLVPGRALMKALAFEYWPRLCDKHPWYPSTSEEVFSLPVVDLGDEDRFEVRPHSDSFVYGFGSLQGTLRMAELLLHISCREASRGEYVLEGEPGFRGVGIASAELGLNLPGGESYYPPKRLGGTA